MQAGRDVPCDAALGCAGGRLRRRRRRVVRAALERDAADRRRRRWWRWWPDDDRDGVTAARDAEEPAGWFDQLGADRADRRRGGAGGADRLADSAQARRARALQRGGQRY